METFKNVLRYLFIAIISFVVFVLLLIYPLIFSLYATVIDQNNVITVLRQSNVYATIPGYIFDQAIKDQSQQTQHDSKGNTTSDNLDPATSNTIKKVLARKDVQDHIQTIVEDVITQAYTQVKSKKSDIQITTNVLEIITLVFTAILQIDSKSVGKYATVATLLKCTIASRINKGNGCTQNIVEINKGFDTQLKQIDPNYRPGDKTFRIISVQQSLIPVIYTNVLIFPFIMLFALLVLIVIDILLFKNKTKGLLEAGIDILIAGLIDLTLWLIFHNSIEAFLKSMNTDAVFIPLVGNTLKLVWNKDLLYTIIMLITAVVIMVSSIVILIIAKNKNAQKPR